MESVHTSPPALTLNKSNKFQHLRQTGLLVMKWWNIIFINTHQNLAFLTMRGCFFPKQSIFSCFQLKKKNSSTNFTPFEVSADKIVLCWFFFLREKKYFSLQSQVSTKKTYHFPSILFCTVETLIMA